MATTVAHAQLIRYDDNGDQIVINLKNTGDDVSISRSSNGNLPTTVTSVQTLANSLGTLAFKSSLSKSDVGLGNVDNTADTNKSVKYAMSAGSANAVAWSNISGKPSTYAPSDHSQAISTITGLQSALDSRVLNSNISSAIDLDTIKTSGIYHIATSLSSGYHAPTTNHHTLFVDFSVGTPYQIFVPDALNAMYKRTYTSGAWSDWMEMKFTDTVYTHPTYTTHSSGLYKFSVDGSGHVNGVTAVSKADITGLGIPGSDTNTWRPLGTTAETACAGNDARLSNARPASDVSAWAKAASKPSYGWSEITGKPTTFPPESHSHSYLPLSGGQMSGSLTFCNSTWNTVGDDVAIGDIDLAGTLGVVGKNGTTTIRLFPYQTDASLRSSNLPAGAAWICTGNNASTITGTLSGTFSGSLSGNASSASSVPWGGVTGKPATYPSEDNLVISKTAPTKTCLWAKID